MENRDGYLGLLLPALFASVRCVRLKDTAPSTSSGGGESKQFRAPPGTTDWDSEMTPSALSDYLPIFGAIGQFERRATFGIRRDRYSLVVEKSHRRPCQSMKYRHKAADVVGLDTETQKRINRDSVSARR